MFEALINTAKMATWAVAGFFVGGATHPVLAQVMGSNGAELPVTWPEAGVIGGVVAIFTWALRESYQRSERDAKDAAQLRVTEAREFAERLDAIHQSKSQFQEQVHAQMRDMHTQQVAFVRDTLLAVLKKESQ